MKKNPRYNLKGDGEGERKREVINGSTNGSFPPALPVLAWAALG